MNVNAPDSPLLMRLVIVIEPSRASVNVQVTFSPAATFTLAVAAARSTALAFVHASPVRRHPAGIVSVIGYVPAGTDANAVVFSPEPPLVAIWNVRAPVKSNDASPP